MLTTVLPDRTTIQTLTPDPPLNGAFLVPLRFITSTRGCERQVFKVNSKINETQKQVEKRVHAAFVRSICMFKNLSYQNQTIKDSNEGVR